MTREEAAKILKEHRERKFKHTFYTLNEYQAATDMAIEALEQEPCDKYIKEIDHLRKYISKLETKIVEQEPCEDCISRQAVLDINFKRIIFATTKPVEMIEQKVKALPSITPQLKIGRWIKTDGLYKNVYSCSECERKVVLQNISKYKFCPNCGAKMEVEE